MSPRLPFPLRENCSCDLSSSSSKMSKYNYLINTLLTAKYLQNYFLSCVFSANSAQHANKLKCDDEHGEHIS